MTIVTLDQAKEISDSASSGNYLKLEDDGDRAQIVFCIKKPDGTDYIFVEESYWNDKLGKNEPYTAQHKAEGKKSNVRYSMNVFVIQEGNKELKNVNAMKILGVNNKTLQTVLKIRDKYGFAKVFEIERKGKKNTKSEYPILPEDRPLADFPGLQALLNSTPLLNLEKKEESSTSTNGASTTHSNGAPAGGGDTISKDMANEIMPRLKALPREKLEKFLTRFGIAAVKALKIGDFATAKAFIDELEGKAAAPVAAAEPVNPFGDD